MDPAQHYPVTDSPAPGSVGYRLMGTLPGTLPVLLNSKECLLVTRGSLQSQDPLQLAQPPLDFPSERSPEFWPERQRWAEGTPEIEPEKTHSWTGSSLEKPVWEETPERWWVGSTREKWWVGSTLERRWVGSKPEKLAEGFWEKAKEATESEGSEGMPEELQEKWSEKKPERVAAAGAAALWWA
ncbi:vegetative cell wall protein gp1-like [Pyrus ussuriensis x Pyrus communis]|uniref:Vegetative cell wall protein gp1-like n=1 Tax=Pyrus ussuriensis x Pyrus communis TaxID=2448454 RepID=A0A5N5FSQ4_9ROSA|nr:vegetative cell wall protein gp1-like [Pyrus ussuriensis x Pyrus communis]